MHLFFSIDIITELSLHIYFLSPGLAEEPANIEDMESLKHHWSRRKFIHGLSGVGATAANAGGFWTVVQNRTTTGVCARLGAAKR